VELFLFITQTLGVFNFGFAPRAGALNTAGASGRLVANAKLISDESPWL
jgi:hypothetical protein